MTLSIMILLVAIGILIFSVRLVDKAIKMRDEANDICEESRKTLIAAEENRKKAAEIMDNITILSNQIDEIILAQKSN